MLHDARHALVVDPGDAQPVLEALQQLGLQLEAILVTHHHPDHIGGVDALRNATGARVFGPRREAIPEPLSRLADGDQFQSLGLTFHVIDGYDWHIPKECESFSKVHSHPQRRLQTGAASNCNQVDSK